MSNTTASGEPIIPPGCAQNTECLEEFGQIDYIPTLPGNALFLGIFALALIAQVFLGIRHRTWGYMSAMIGGCILEIVGYVGRLMLNDDIFNDDSFIIYLVGLTIGPAFYSAALYLCMSRIVAIYGTSLPLVKARTMTILFIGGDFISLLLQATGGAIASTADDQEGSDLGVNILIAGLAVQVVVTSVFLAACLHLMWAIRKYPHKVISETSAFRKTFAFRFFLYGKPGPPPSFPLLYVKRANTFPPSNRHQHHRHPYPLHLPLRRAQRRLRR